MRFHNTIANVANRVKNRRLTSAISLKIVLALIFAAIVAFGRIEFSASTSAQDALIDAQAVDQARSISSAFRQAAQKVLPATAKIIVKRDSKVDSVKSKLPFGDLLPDVPEQDLIEGAGSGFVVDPSGVVLTNCHVVEQFDVGKAISVELNDGRSFPAKKIVKDAKSDLAIIQIESAEPLPCLAFADSDVAEIGDWVLAVGNPFMLGSSVSAGIVSAKERFISDDSKVFIQTDAAVNPGNSGGPLVNLQGEVIGVNTAIASKNGGYQGVGFAIPSNVALWVLNQLREKGKVERAFLGAPIYALEFNEARRLGLETRVGVKMGAPFKDSPAAKAGLRANDALLAIDGRPIESVGTFEAFVERADVQKTYTLRVLRYNSKTPVDVPITFAVKPDGYVGVPLAEKMTQKGAHYMDKEWGMMIIPAAPEALAKLGFAQESGLIVLNATPGKAAYASGVRNGALILKLNGVEVKTLEEYQAAKEQNANDEAELEIVVKSEQKTVKLPNKKGA